MSANVLGRQFHGDTSMSKDATVDDEVQDVSSSRPHVVILGAGASRAAFPNGDAQGHTLPVMLDLVETLQLDGPLCSLGVEYRNRDFEEVYAQLAGDPRYASCKAAVEDRVAAYFAQLQTPVEPTIYDLLVLSLRSKDVIATFNWDPFLWHALARNACVAKPPHFFFLHGCALVGFCQTHRQQGQNGATCLKCGTPYRPTRLLYPVTNKDYTADPYLVSQWSSLCGALAQAFVVTIFGYSAPRSDAAAIELMRTGWGHPSTRRFEEFEFIDLKSRSDLYDRWEQFIFGHHCRFTESFFDSIIVKHPRRTCEAMWKELMEAEVLPENRPPSFASLEDAKEWFRRLVKIEEAAA